MKPDAEATKAGPSGSGESLRVLGKYQIERHLGTGGMGAVYLAKDSELKRQVAIKILPQDKAQNPVLVRRFRAEAQAAAQLHHENIVTVYETGEAAGHLFIAMEFVDGTDLHQLISRRGRVPVKRSIEIIRQCASALQHAFEQNIVHRDIKPSNLLIRRDGTVKLTDLGLARSVDDTLETGITRAGTTVGTVDYMAPEQARSSKSADTRSDLYSLGCTWFHMLTGHAPYNEGSLTNKLHAHATQAIPDPRSENENVTEALAAVIRRLMAKKPEDRYQTPAALLEDLGRAALTRHGMAAELLTEIEGESGTPRRRSGRSAPIDSGPRLRGDTDRDGYDLDDDDWDAADGDTAHEQPATSEASGKRRSKKSSEPEEDPSLKSSSKKSGKSANDRGSSKSGESGKSSESGKKEQPERAPLKRGRRRLQSEKQDEAPSSPPILKYLGVGVAVVAVVVGLALIVQQFSLSLESGSIATGANPFNESQGPAPEINESPIAPAETPVQAVAEVAPGVTVRANPLAPQPGTAKTAPAVQVAANDASVQAELQSVNSGTDEPGDNKQSWVSRLERPIAAGKVVTVGPGTGTRTHAGTIAEAIALLPEEGGTLQLVGDGIFPLGPLKVDRPWLTILAAPETRPLIRCTAIEGSDEFGLVANAAHLELRGLHFAADREQIERLNGAAFVTATCREVGVTDCSFTLLYGKSKRIGAAPPASGTTQLEATPDQLEATPEIVPVSATQEVPSPSDWTMSAIRLLAEGPRDSRALISQTFFRGPGLVGLDVRGPVADVLLRRSLIVSQDAPSVWLTGAGREAKPNEPLSPHGRRIRFEHSSLCGTEILRCAVPKGSPAPRTSIDWDGCAVSAVPASEPTRETVLLTAADWPQSSSRAPEDGRLDSMTWTTAGTVFFGFAKLANLGADAAVTVADAEFWARIWKKSVDPAQFQGAPWPSFEGVRVSTVAPQRFDRSGMSFRDITSIGHGLPGVEAAWFNWPQEFSEERLEALSRRPTIPANVAPATDAPVRSVNLATEDLGLVLSQVNLADGTLIDAFGSGRHLMTPAVIANRRIRIHLRQTDGAKLTLEPKLLGSAPPEALLKVQGGAVELIGGTLAASPASRRGAPAWVIACDDGSLLMRGVELRGPLILSNEYQGLLRLRGTAPADSSGGNALHAALSYCFLESATNAIQFEGQSGGLAIEQSVIVARGAGLRLVPASATADLRIAASRVTWSAARAAIDLAPETPLVPTNPLATIFVDQSVFAPPWRAKPTDPATAAILALPEGMATKPTIDWWGTSNGAAPEVKQPLLVGVQGQDFDAWASTWSKDRDLRMLSGLDSVVLATAGYPTASKDLQPRTFLLHPSAKACGWGEGGQRIGADVGALETALNSGVGFTNPGKNRPSATPGGAPAGTPKKNKPDF